VTTALAQSRRRRVWGALAVAIVVLGASGSVFAAVAVSHERAHTSLSDSKVVSAQIGETLRLSLQHEYDLMASAQSFELDAPHTTQPQFAEWAKNERIVARYPELFAIGAIQIVPRADLEAFAARYPISWMSNPKGPDEIVVVPSGVRPYYCLATVMLLQNAAIQLPRGLDVCKVIPGVNLKTTPFTGTPALAPARFLGVNLLSMSVPLYRGGSIPPTIAARRAEFSGFVGIFFNTSSVIRAALVGHPNTEVALQYGGATSHVLFHFGTAPQGARVNSVNLHDGWTAMVSMPTSSGAVAGDSGALALLLGGLVLSLLLAGVIFLLGTGRARAVQLVHERTAELQFLALHDPLTGQPNRTLILDRATQMLARARRNHVPTALFFLDLDDFKDVNDSLGHQAGDRVLIVVASRLVAELREGDTVGRLGGDEFIVLLEGDALHGGSKMVADRIISALQVPFSIPDSEVPLTISASIGIAEGDRATAEELLRDADTALYRAKAQGKRRAVTFSPNMQVDAEDRRSLASDLGMALNAGEFFLVYQPTIDLQTSALTGVEALIRWRHPERGVVEPNDFIPELEASGLIVPVGTWVLNTACRQGAAWMAQGHRFTVSVNVSVLQLARPEFVSEVDEALTLSGLDPSALILEFTESTLMRNGTETIAQLEELKSRGVRLAVDDFGTGYSSLAYLRQFPMDVVKIDRAFVAGLTSSTEGAALVHALVQLGKALNLQTVAEGIEDDDQRLRLQVEDVDIGQGYLFSRPLDLDDVESFLERYSSISGMPI
jgi:diguanylate cyclase (GGDEF)-like protein